MSGRGRACAMHARFLQFGFLTTAKMDDSVSAKLLCAGGTRNDVCVAVARRTHVAGQARLACSKVALVADRVAASRVVLRVETVGLSGSAMSVGGRRAGKPHLEGRAAAAAVAAVAAYSDRPSVEQDQLLHEVESESGACRTTLGRRLVDAIEDVPDLVGSDADPGVAQVGADPSGTGTTTGDLTAGRECGRVVAQVW